MGPNTLGCLHLMAALLSAATTRKRQRPEGSKAGFALWCGTEIPEPDVR
jgi:hypothetical protein